MKLIVSATVLSSYAIRISATVIFVTEHTVTHRLRVTADPTLFCVRNVEVLQQYFEPIQTSQQGIVSMKNQSLVFVGYLNIH